MFILKGLLMAIIIGAPSFGQMSGSIGANNFYLFRGRQCVRMKPLPKNILSPDQAISRNHFNRALNDWQNGNFSLPESVYDAWGSQSVFSSRGQSYPLTGEQFFLGYRSLHYAHPALPSEPTLQPSTRPPGCNYYMVYFPLYDIILVFVDGPIGVKDFFFAQYTDHWFPTNNIKPRSFPHSETLIRRKTDAENLICHLGFNDSAANTTVKDNTINGLNFAFCDATGNPNTDAHASPGYCNRSLNFDLIDDYCSRVYDSKFAFTYPHSFSGRIYLDGATGTNRMLWRCEDATPGALKGIAFWVTSTGHLALRIRNVAYQVLIYSDFTIPLNTWTQIGYTMNVPLTYFYKNGSRDAGHTIEHLPAAPTGLPFTIGSPTPGAGLGGYMDSFRWFDNLIGPPEFWCLFSFEKDFEFSYPWWLYIRPTFHTGTHRIWLKVRQVEEGGGWAPMRYASLDLLYPPI